jgi:STE24 endopeptidase
VNLALHWGVVALGFGSVDNIAAFPILVITAAIVGFLAMPLTNGFSRFVERQADDYAMRLTGKPRAFADAMVRLGNQNVAELHPARWVVVLLYDHPPLDERIAAAEAFERKQ